MIDKFNIMYVDNNICEEFFHQLSLKYFLYTQNTITIHEINSLKKKKIRLLIISINFLKDRDILKAINTNNIPIIIFLNLKQINEINQISVSNLWDFFIKPFILPLVVKKINLFFYNFSKNKYQLKNNKYLQNLNTYILQKLLYQHKNFYNFLQDTKLSLDFLLKQQVNIEFYTYILYLLKDTSCKDSINDILEKTIKILKKKFVYLNYNINWIFLYGGINIPIQNTFKDCFLFLILMSEILLEIEEEYNLEVMITGNNQNYILNIIGQKEIVNYFFEKYNNFTSNKYYHFKNLLHIYLRKNFKNFINILPKSDRIHVIEIFL
ncbi:hypothetical protein AB836_00395 [Rickettsiales bacterium (ex Bugula neritina AB1)]|nr:hypothetical protein AB836_00395 [Rickettsiales bacterium (ex Bugula neritina AB1)]